MMKEPSRINFKRWTMLLVLAAFFGTPSAGNDEVDVTKELGIYLAQHGYGSMPAANKTSTNRQYVRARINGKDVSLLVDTGCDRTVITANCARHLKLDVHDSGHVNFALAGPLKGDTGIAAISSFTLNNYEINRLSTIEVLPKSADTGEIEDGLFGFAELRLNAVLLPVGASVLLFRPGDNAAPPIDHYMGLLGFKAVPLRHGKDGLYVEGQLDGQPFTALVDCGAEYSTFDLDYVRSRKQRTYEMNGALHGLDGRPRPGYIFTAQALNFGPVAFDPTRILACQAAAFKHDSCNALLGYDLLGAHKAIIDLGHEVLWMK